MQQLIFVTGNDDKFRSARLTLAPFGVAPVQRRLDIAEIQSEQPEQIIRDKAKKAHDILGQPLIVSDDSWSIPALGGFPGPYMASMNHWFTPEDFQRLTAHLADRRITLHQYVLYKDGQHEQLFSTDIPAVLVPSPRGDPNGHPCATMISFDGGKHTMAEVRENGKSAISDLPNCYHNLGRWLAHKNQTR